MIYHLYCALIMSGYAACSTLLGGFMMLYAGAREIDLGFIFMVQPMTIFFRPFICAQADRRQTHRQMLAFYAVLTALAYVPFIIYPFCYKLLLRQPTGNGNSAGNLKPALEHPTLDRSEEMLSPDLAELFIDDKLEQQSQRVVFWTLMAFHLIGSIGFCGVRSLGDALAVNYAKRIGTDFARFRKYGSMSYGLCNFLLGFINQDWLVPSYVPALSVYTGSMLLLALLVFFWPREYFEMSCQDNEDERAQRAYIESLPSSGKALRQVVSGICCCTSGGGKTSADNRPHHQQGASGQSKLTISTKFQLTEGDASRAKSLNEQDETGRSGHQDGDRQHQQRPKHQLSVGQQLRIFGLLLKRDFRIVLYLLIILYGGLTGYSGPNFVFTYINLVCTERGTCKGSELSGLVMLAYCFVETTVYLIVDRWGHRFNRTIALEVTFLVLAFHYNFYGFALDYLSPYFFLVESLHGIEYGISLTTSVNMGYYFAREVELLLPELTRKGIIGPDDDLELVKVSLMATMSGCYTLAYDGVGCILGCLLFGLVLGNFGFNVMWVSIGAAAAVGFLVILIGYTIGKCFKIRPEILRIRDSLAEGSSGDDRASA